MNSARTRPTPKELTRPGSRLSRTLAGAPMRIGAPALTTDELEPAVTVVAGRIVRRGGQAVAITVRPSLR